MREFRGYFLKSKFTPIESKYAIQKRADKTGMVFGRLKVIEALGVDGKGNRWWGCLCTCGIKVVTISRDLANGDTKSCGCLQIEIVKRKGGKNILPIGHASRNELLASYKKSALARNYKWEISNNTFFDLVSSNCSYCGTPPDSFRKPNKHVNGGFWYSGVDRIDNLIGYEVDNVVSCCWICNRAKSNISKEEFNAWIDRLTSFNKKKIEHGENVNE